MPSSSIECAPPPRLVAIPPPPGAPLRRLPFDQLCNVRDLGGYRASDGRTVRWGVVYRTDALGRAGAWPGDVERLRRLGLRSVIDLRTEAELRALPPLDLATLEAEWHHHPVLSRTWGETGAVPLGESREAVSTFLAARYVEMLSEGAGAIGSTLALLSEPDALPLAFGCAVGKDRTGVVAAIVLALLGVDDATIAHDYGLSRLAMAELQRRLAATDPDAHRRLITQPAAYLDAPPSAIRQMLAVLRGHWGSVESYADSLFVDSVAVGRLRRALLS